MKILLDECLPVALRRHLQGHDVYTISYMGWKGIQNGSLLTLASSDGFDAFITVDRNLQFQQNLTGLPLPVLVLEARSIRLIDLLHLVPALIQALATPTLPNAVIRVRG